MHVLLICNSLTLGGAEKYLIDLANSLIERGIKVTMAYGGPVLHEPGPVDGVHHLEINAFKYSGRLGPLRLIVGLPTGKRLYKYIHDTGVDIVNTAMFDLGIWGWLTGRFLGVPAVYTPMHVYGNYVPIERLLIGSRVGTNVIKLLGLNFIAVSDYFAEELAELGKVPLNHIHTASLGVDLKKFHPEAADDGIRKTLGLRTGPLFGTIGRLHKVKGCHRIVASMPAILKECPQAQLLLVGDGPERENLQNQAKQLGVQDSVFFAGWRTDTVGMTNLLDIYVAATDGPNLGLSALQAMAQGKPLVYYAKDHRERRMAADTVHEDVNGYIVPTNEPGKAGEIIGRVLNDTHRLKEMGQASRKLAEERFDWQSHVSKVIEIYQGLKDRT